LKDRFTSPWHVDYNVVSTPVVRAGEKQHHFCRIDEHQ